MQKKLFVTRESLLPPLKRRVKCNDMDISRLENIQIDVDKYCSLEDIKKEKNKNI